MKLPATGEQFSFFTGHSQFLRAFAAWQVLILDPCWHQFVCCVADNKPKQTAPYKVETMPHGYTYICEIVIA